MTMPYQLYQLVFSSSAFGNASFDFYAFYRLKQQGTTGTDIPSHAHPIPTKLVHAAERDWALDPQLLQDAIVKDEEAGLIPCYLEATVGTTSSCAIDPIDKLGVITKQHRIW